MPRLRAQLEEHFAAQKRAEEELRQEEARAKERERMEEKKRAEQERILKVTHSASLLTSSLGSLNVQLTRMHDSDKFSKNI